MSSARMATILPKENELSYSLAQHSSLKNPQLTIPSSKHKVLILVIHDRYTEVLSIGRQAAHLAHFHHRPRRHSGWLELQGR